MGSSPHQHRIVAGIVAVAAGTAVAGIVAVADHGLLIMCCHFYLIFFFFFPFLKKIKAVTILCVATLQRNEFERFSDFQEKH